MEPKYPDIIVKLEGEDGNIFNLMIIVIKALRKAKVPLQERASFLEEIQASHSYDQALQVIMKWVNVEQKGFVAL